MAGGRGRKGKKFANMGTGRTNFEFDNVPKHDKIKMVRKATGPKNTQDRASVKYNYHDFLQASDNITD